MLDTPLFLRQTFVATRPVTIDGRDYRDGEVIDRSPALTDRLIQQLFTQRRITIQQPPLPQPDPIPEPEPEPAHDPHCRVRRR